MRRLRGATLFAAAASDCSSKPLRGRSFSPLQFFSDLASTGNPRMIAIDPWMTVFTANAHARSTHYLPLQSEDPPDQAERIALLPPLPPFGIEVLP